MKNNVNVPNGNQQVTVNLTVKEILALAGDKFNQDHSILIQARKKIREQLDKKQ